MYFYTLRRFSLLFLLLRTSAFIFSFSNCLPFNLFRTCFTDYFFYFYFFFSLIVFFVWRVNYYEDFQCLQV